MKKLILSILAFTAIHVYAGEVYVGPKLGGSFSTMRLVKGDAADKAAFNEFKKLYVGPNAGINIFARINNYVGIQPEINFLMSGLKYGDATGFEVIRYMQLQVPVMVKGGYGKEHFFVYGSFGPYFTASIIAQDVLKLKGSSKQKEKLDFADDGLQRFDAGLGAGVGAMYIMKRGALDFEFRYNIGLVKQFKQISGNTNAKWSAFGIALAYMFKSGGK